MIKFVKKQKEYTEYEAMRALFVELKKYNKRIDIIDTNSLIPILKGNNVVIERFVINRSLFGKDRFRMYLKIGAKAKMPDKVRLARQFIDKSTFMNGNLKITGGLLGKSGQKQFGKSKSGGGPKPYVSSENYLNYQIEKESTKLLGETILYDKNERLLVLEFSSISNAIQALDILPFGLNYKLYLLDS